MPRNRKPRICGCPFDELMCRVFKPAGIPMTKLQQIPLFQDELEAMRLCDIEELTQEDAGKKMGVSRGTVQRLLADGRKKTVCALTEGKALILKNEQ